MKRALLALALCLAAAPVTGQERTQTNFIAPLGYCQLTPLTSATLLSSCTGGIPTRTAYALMCTDAVAVRWRDDGTAPTTTVSMPIAAGGCLGYSGSMSAIQFIAGAAATLNISFYSGAPPVR